MHGMTNLIPLFISADMRRIFMININFSDFLV